MVDMVVIVGGEVEEGGGSGGVAKHFLVIFG